MHGVHLHLLHVLLLGGTIACTDALVVACVKRVALLEGSKEWSLLLGQLLLGEGDVCAECRKVGLESASLAHSVGPWLVTVQNPAILLGVLVTTLVLLPFIGVLRVAYFVEAREWVSLDTRRKPWSTLGDWACWRTLRLPRELASPHFFVRAGREGLDFSVL